MGHPIPMRLADAGATFALGRRLGSAARPGDLLALVGPLGAGKTCLAQGLGAGLGVRGPVTSPTFVLVQLHEGGRLPFVHADLYRLGSGEEILELGLDDLLVGAVGAVEWADRFPGLLPPDRLELELELLPGGARRVLPRPLGPGAARWWSEASGG